MTIPAYVKAVEKQIETHQRVQMANKYGSAPWEAASKEIHRLSALIVATSANTTA